ncbi:MAG TPA: RNA methyltransferase [Treponema sp.]|nr:RNA methyltransferase [Treponema sp.]
MKRFILHDVPDKNGTVRLAGEDYHYLINVRRLAPGERFPALLPSGDNAVVRIVSAGGGVLTGECSADDDSGGTDVAAAVADIAPVILFQALPKGEKMDIIVRQAAEGGIAEIVPFQSEFSVVKIKGNERGKKRAAPETQTETETELSGAKLSRWRRIIKEARQQSGSRLDTVVRPPMTSDEMFAYWDSLKTGNPGALGILFHQAPVEAALESGGADTTLAKRSLHGYLDRCPRLVVMAIGPEGGFSSAEVSRFLEAGFEPLTIGDTVLRTETAALYAAAAVRIILLERNSWEMKKCR